MEQMQVAVRAKKFKTGEIVITPPASAALDASGLSASELVLRHQSGDWGEVSDVLRGINDRGIAEQFSLQSIYTIASFGRLVVVTNRERTLTTIHLDPQVV